MLRPVLLSCEAIIGIHTDGLACGLPLVMCERQHRVKIGGSDASDGPPNGQHVTKAKDTIDAL